MKSKINIKKILLLIVAAIITLSSTSSIAFAEESVDLYPFDRTNVLDDLKSSDGFAIGDYYFDFDLLTESAGITNFVEWCYSANGEQDDFALYVYFYNPQKLDIKTDSASNRIQMATAYDKGKAYINASPTSYSTFPLIYCNKSTATGYEGLFYKFRIQLSTTAKRVLLLNLQSTQRRYDVSGITLATSDTVKEFPVGGTFRFTGYAKGYGVDGADSTLECLEFLPLETIRLEVTSTNYRTVTSGLGVGHQNDITSVYFSVPKKYIYDDNGNEIANLQRIKAEWWEYKTNPIYVVGSQAAYDAMISNVSNPANAYDKNFSNGYGLGIDELSVAGATGLIYDRYNYTYNADGVFGIITETSRINFLHWLFPCVKVTDEDVLVTKEQLENYAKNHKGHVYESWITVGSQQISADLFQGVVDDGRTMGYNVKEFDNTVDRFDILSYKDTHGDWQAFFDYGFWQPTEESREDIAPIEMVSKDNLSMTNNNLGYKYLVNSSDVNKFRTVSQTAWESDQVPYIFHFAQTDYYSEAGSVLKDGEKVADAQRSVETVFLDFKIITLTFKTGEDYKVIPVTQDPINIYKTITEHPDYDFQGEDDITMWDKILSALLLIAMVAVEIALVFVEGYLLKISVGHKVVDVIIKLLIVVLGIVLDIFVCKYFIDIIKGYGWLFQ